jgi:FHA domain
MTGRQIEVVPGNHLVAVANRAIVVVAHRGPSPLTPDSGAVKTWLALHKLIVEASAKAGDQFGPALTALAVQWAGGHGDDAEFGVLAPAAGGYAVFLRGRVAATIDRDNGPETIRGSHHPGTKLDIECPVSGRAGLYALDDDNAAVRLPAQRGIGSLTDGVAHGGGAVVWPEPSPPRTNPAAEPRAKPIAPQPKPPPAAPARESAHVEQAHAPRPAQPLDLKPPKIFDTFTPDDKPPPRRAPLPVRPTGRPQPATVTGPPRPGPLKHPVRGITCARGHFNDPRVAFCRLCGLRMNQTKVFSEGERPPLGFLVLDDGMTFILNDDLVFGRQPEGSPVVRRGATPIRLADPDGNLSRAHAEFRLVDWDVAVVDLGSTNGTYVQPPGQHGWHRLTPQQLYVLAAGCDVRLGERMLTFDSPHARI